ncbi:hypothetical protein PCO31111_00225 [Pandoraea communis]|uniref:Uncharacterized protein n=1 Tax=Pandoraea communis TaxID=2508297 RepID=A0A5E4RIZ7_9BURK|nr:hypothetical protein PCO31111_00225 [Pandoraea communis]
MTRASLAAREGRVSEALDVYAQSFTQTLRSSV